MNEKEIYINGLVRTADHDTHICSMISKAIVCVSETNCRRVVDCGGVPMTLQMYREWHKMDTKNRQISLRKSLLNILKHVTNTSKHYTF